MGNIQDIAKNAWGQYYEVFISERKAAPDYSKPPTFDPQLGFSETREEREMVATQEEMDAACIDLAHRDYCAHLLINWKQCMRKNMPCYWRCKHDKHIFLECQYEDAVMRVREYERERRLKIRELALAGLDPNGKPLVKK